MSRKSQRNIRGLNIGNNKIGWAIVKWSDVLEIVNGKNQKSVENKDGKYPIYGSGGVMNYADDFLCPENTTIVGRKGTINKPILVREKFWNVDTAFGIVAGKDLNPFFLNYFCQSFNFLSLNKSTTLPSLAKRDLKEIKIPLPPLPEQRAIVAKLDGLFERIDRAIALVKENIAHTEALMGSVLDEEFGNESNELISLEELVEKTKNRNPKKDNIPFQYIDISSVDKEKHKLTTTKLTLAKDAPSRAKKEVFKGDIIFATTRPNLKNIARITLDDDNLIASTGFCVLRPKENKLDNDYLFYFLISDVVQSQIAPFTKGAQYPAISDKVVKALLIPNKDYNKQISISKRLKNSLERIEDVKSKHSDTLSYLEGLKQSLLDVAFKGELV